MVALQESTRAAGSHAFILVTILIDGLGAGIVTPILPQLVTQLTGEGLSNAALYGGWLMSCHSLMQFFAAPILGNLSDCYGRRPVLLGSLAAFGVNYLLMGLSSNIGYLFVGELIAGIFAATIGAAGAYIADTTVASDRARRFGLLTAAYGTGFALGPMIGGLLAEYGSRAPFLFSAALALANVLYGWFVLPESLDPAQRRKFSIQRANPIGALRQLKTQSRAYSLLGSLALMQIAAMAVPVTWAYFTMLKFDWSHREVGASLSFYAIASITAQGIILGVLCRKLGHPRTAYLGYIAMVIGSLGYAFSSDAFQLIAFILPSALGTMVVPALISYLSNHTPADAQGELQGTVVSVSSATAIFAPLLMTQLFSVLSSHTSPVYLPGAPYIAAAVFAVLGLALSVRSFKSE